MNLALHLARAAGTRPDAPALFLGPAPVASFSGLLESAARLARTLRQTFRLQPGDRVALAMRNAPEFVEVLYAAWQAGLAVVPISPRLHPREMAYIIENSGARLCFTSDELATMLDSIKSDLSTLERIISIDDHEYVALKQTDPLPMTPRQPSDLAWLFYTSGTTGRPKGAELTHRNLLTMSCGYHVDLGPVAPANRLLHIAPMCHGSGLYIMNRMMAGAAQVIPESRRLDPAEVFHLIETHPGLGFFAPPTIVNRLVQSPDVGRLDIGKLGTIVYGGAPMYGEDIKRALACFGPRLAQIYGQGETPMAISVLPASMHVDTGDADHEARLASVGIPQSVVEVRIGDDQDNPVAAGEIGEVLVRGDTVMRGYWLNPEATASSLRNGWLHTGDMAAMDKQGFITLKDRDKDVIISGGANIYPREVEEILLRHPSVLEVSVVGKRDPEWGEAVVAFVVCAPGGSVNEAELDRLCRENIARYKRPKEYRFLPELPKSSIGKILKRDLRALLAESSQVATS